MGDAAEALGRDRSVRIAEPDGYSRIQSVPDDARFAELWGLRNLAQNVGGVTGGVAGADIGATLAWDRTSEPPQRSSPTSTPATASGTRTSRVYWTNPGEIGGNGIDDDANGMTDDTRGWDAVGPDNDPTDAANGHGVHTAGTIGAKGNDGIGVTGVAQSVRIMAVPVCGDDGLCQFSDEIEGINYAGRNGARAANMSFGGTRRSAGVLAALAANPQVLFVISAGNDDQDNDSVAHYPPTTIRRWTPRASGTRLPPGLSTTSSASRRRRSPTAGRRSRTTGRPRSTSARRERRR